MEIIVIYTRTKLILLSHSPLDETDHILWVFIILNHCEAMAGFGKTMSATLLFWWVFWIITVLGSTGVQEDPVAQIIVVQLLVLHIFQLNPQWINSWWLFIVAKWNRPFLPIVLWMDSTQS